MEADNEANLHKLSAVLAPVSPERAAYPSPGRRPGSESRSIAASPEGAIHCQSHACRASYSNLVFLKIPML